MRGVMSNPSQRKRPERHSGPPCPHYPHKFKTEAAHKAKVASRLRSHRRFMKSSLDYRLKQVLRTIAARCESPKFIGYKYYGGRGIKNFLTLEDLKVLWERDGAALMRKPSIDRAHRDDNYEFSKCAFVELVDNVRRGVEYRESTRRPRRKPTAIMETA